MSSVQLANIEKTFGAVKVLRGIDLSVADGEFLALVGPSGCGKSTLLRIIAGLEPETGGQVAFDDSPVDHLTPRERNVAMVFQSYALYPHMTVSDNIAFNLRINGVDKARRMEMVAETARLLHLEDLLDRRPAQLSGGQRQRVAMGRAIVRHPSVFLFDEPLSNLDAALRVLMRAEIKLLHQKVRTTSIYVTHDQIEAMTLADRIVVMNKGRIEQIGTPLDLYLRPANLFVAGFIGSPAMNFLKATIADRGDGPIAAFNGGGSLPLSAMRDLTAGMPVIVGLRAEHLRPGPGIEGPVLLTEPMGAQTQVTLDLGGEKLVVLLSGSEQPLPGTVLSVGVMPENIHLFDGESGRRLSE